MPPFAFADQLQQHPAHDHDPLTPLHAVPLIQRASQPHRGSFNTRPLLCLSLLSTSQTKPAPPRRQCLTLFFLFMIGPDRLSDPCLKSLFLFSLFLILVYPLFI